jgi:hypothetical protein
MQANKYNIVSELQNYMFSKVIQTPVIQTPVIQTPVIQTPVIQTPVIQTPVITIKSLFFSPKGQPDTLFWCFYVMANGIVSYEKEPASFEKEKIEKIKYISVLRNNKILLKQHNIRKFSEIETNLSLDRRINLNTFFALCALEKLNAVIIKNKIYEDIIPDPTLRVHILHCYNDRFKLEYEMMDASNLTYASTHFKMPLKSISGYKINDLRCICSKLEVILPASCKKKQIYELLTEFLNKIDCI